MNKSWKTTLGGAVNAFGMAGVLIYPEHAKPFLLLAALGTSFGLMFARDNDKTSEDVGAKDKTPTAVIITTKP